jgi:acetyl-CoA C-acetyltransferase
MIRMVGNILPAGLRQGLARQISIKSGIPTAVPHMGEYGLWFRV